MTASEFKTLVNFELDAASAVQLGRRLTEDERAQWWTTPQAGVLEPYLLMVVGTEQERRAVVEAARKWHP